MELYDFLQYVFLRGMCLGGVCRQLQHFPHLLDEERPDCYNKLTGETPSIG